MNAVEIRQQGLYDIPSGEHFGCRFWMVPFIKSDEVFEDFILNNFSVSFPSCGIKSCIVHLFNLQTNNQKKVLNKWKDFNLWS